jgi:hypothetical protein
MILGNAGETARPTEERGFGGFNSFISLTTEEKDTFEEVAKLQSVQDQDWTETLKEKCSIKFQQNDDFYPTCLIQAYRGWDYL